MNGNDPLTPDVVDTYLQSKDPLFPYRFWIAATKHDDKAPPQEINFLTSLEHDKVKLFVVDNVLDHVFSSTKPSTVKEEVRMPFSDMFLSIQKKLSNGFTLVGMHVCFLPKSLFEGMVDFVDNTMEQKYNIPKNEVLTEFARRIENDKRNICSVSGKFVSPDLTVWHSVNVLFDLENGKKWNHAVPTKNSRLQSYFKNYLREYVLNVLLFLNEPRVEVHVHASNNLRREKKGKIPIPSRLVTVITPELRHYINFSYESRNKLDYAYDVRGHWRVLKHPRYGEHVGKKIWIAPFVKGSGLKPPQVFSLQNKHYVRKELL